jgi:two-component system phosphate regulon sensor histidine kinase PhoR
MMVRPLKRIGIILIIIILLPAAFFSIYEIGSLSSSERVIEEIYNNQLDAILYSVNQFSEDVVSSWTNKININSVLETLRPEQFAEELKKLQRENPIKQIFIVDDLKLDNLRIFSPPSPEIKKISLENDATSEDAKFRSAVKSLVRNNTNKIIRLYTYRRGGYRKIESVQTNLSDNSILLIFLLDNEDKPPRICGMFVDPINFIRRTLGPKLQEVSQGKFIISVMRGENNQRVYITESTSAREISLKKQLWLLPSFNLSIVLKGTTIQSLVKSRYYVSLILIIILNLVLIAGVWFVFRNIRQEIQLAQIKSDFVSNVSHELRTPLALISMFSETLEMGRVRSEDRKKEYYGIISQEASRLSRIVNKILSFSQIEAGKRKYNFDIVDINEIVQKIYNTYSFHMQNNGFVFTFEPDESLPELKADSESIGEAVINLIDNAAKYSKDKKVIHIKTAQSNDYVFIEVKDEGIGISAENQKRIFEKFYRVTSGDIHNTKGTGLGLTLVKHIMEAHKGSISLFSTPGKGSTFRLNFNLNNDSISVEKK